MVAAQVGAPPQQPPSERLIPVGTATLSGTVSSSDGRGVKGVRVTVSGQVPQNMARGAAAIDVGMRGGVPGGGIPVTTRGSVPTSLTRATMTDANGQFSFPRMPAGQFMVSVQHQQFLSGSYGQRRSGGAGAWLSLADGQQLDIKVPIQRGGVISGRVVGPEGEPVFGVQLRAWRYSFASGFKRLLTANYATADDRGNYRIFGLQPGEYLVSAMPSGGFDPLSGMTPFDLVERAIASGRAVAPKIAGQTPTVSVQIPAFQAGQYVPAPGYLQTFAPSAMMPSDATAITVGADQERTGVDIVVRFTLAGMVQGDVVMPTDPAVHVHLTLINDDQTMESGENQARADTNGKFYFRGVRPGRYTVAAMTVPAPTQTVPGQPQPQVTLTDAQKLWGRVPVSVSGDGTVSVNVTLRPGRSISGVVLFEMSRPPDLARSKVSVVLAPAPTSPPTYYVQPPQAQVGPDGQFTFTGVGPGTYILRVTSSGTMKSAVISGQDTLDFPLEFTAENDVTGAVLTVTDAPTELSGTLTDMTGKPVTDYQVLAVATDNRYWTPASRRVVLARTGLDGRYSVRALPAGTYSVCVVTDIEPGAQYDPEFLKSILPASVPVTISDGGKVVQDLRVR